MRASCLRAFSSLTPAVAGRCLHSPGFAGLGLVHRPGDWSKAGEDAVVKCNDLVERVVNAPPSQEVVDLLDEISDTARRNLLCFEVEATRESCVFDSTVQALRTQNIILVQLCQVLDAAEFCRNVHVDPAWRGAATKVCIELGGYVQGLNTHAGLYNALDRTLRDTSVLQGEALEVGRSLARDFRRYGVHLADSHKEEMASLTARIQELGFAFSGNLVNGAAAAPLRLPVAEVRRAGALPSSVRAFRTAGGDMIVSADEGTLATLQANSHSTDVRARAYLWHARQPEVNGEILAELIASRHRVAELMGYRSFAAYQLDAFSLAQSPGAVEAFLGQLGDALEAPALREAQNLANAYRPSSLSSKQQQTGCGSSSLAVKLKDSAAPHGVLAPWDVSYLKSIARAASGAPLSSLPLNVRPRDLVAGLDRLMTRLMGVRVREEAITDVDEAWAPRLLKLVISEADGTQLGTVYWDFEPRPDKMMGGAHFVLRCGCGHEVLTRRSSSSTIQTPIVALLASLPWEQPLHAQQLELLLHEWGHAMHTLLSATRYQHLSGTRGPLDLMEVPSHIFEHFARDRRTLRVLLDADEESAELVTRALNSQRHSFAALGLLHQAQLCLIDCALHSNDEPLGLATRQLATAQLPAEKTQASAAIASATADILAWHSPLASLKGTAPVLPQLRFNHLMGYGATYYSYLTAQAISARLWHRLNDDPLSASSGDVLRDRLLRPGGSLPAREAIAKLFGHAREAGQELDGGLVPDPVDLLVELGLAH